MCNITNIPTSNYCMDLWKLQIRESYVVQYPCYKPSFFWRNNFLDFIYMQFNNVKFLRFFKCDLTMITGWESLHFFEIAIATLSTSCTYFAMKWDLNHHVLLLIKSHRLWSKAYVIGTINSGSSNLVLSGAVLPGIQPFKRW